jgi:hypothetical protein
MLDSRWIPVLLVAGWVLLTLGLWGGLGRQWWIWPISLGALSLSAGAAFGWAAIMQMRRPGASPP